MNFLTVSKRLILSVCSIVLFVAVLPASAQGFELSETFDDGVVTFAYPEGWYVCDCDPAEPVAILGTTEEVAKTYEYPRGEIQLFVYKDFVEFLNFLGFEVPADARTSDALALLVEQVRDVEELTDGVYAYFSVDGAIASTLYVVWNLDGTIVGFSAASRDIEDLEDFESTLLEMAQSFAFSDGGNSNNDNTNNADVQIYSDDLVSFDYPADLRINDDDPTSILVGNSRNSVDPEGILEEGEFTFDIYPSLAETFGSDWDDRLNAEEVFDTYLADLEGFDFGRLRDDELNGLEVVYAEFTAPDDTDPDVIYEGVMYIFDYGIGDMGLFFGLALEGEYRDFEDIILEVLETVRPADSGGSNTNTTTNNADNPNAITVDLSNAPDLSEDFRSDDIDFTFSYPEDWFPDTADEIAVVVSNEALYENFDLENLSRDDLGIIIYPTLASIGYTETGNDSPSTVVSYFASTGFIEGYEQYGAMQVGELDGRAFSQSIATNGTNDRIVACVTSQDDDSIICAIAVAAEGEIMEFQDEVAAILLSAELR
jgi:hypothetical protein